MPIHCRSFLLVAALVASTGARAEPAVVFDMGGKFDKSFNESAYRGIEKWKKDTGKPYLEFEIANETQREQALRRMAERGATPIIGIGFGQAAAMDKIAREFPKLQFAIIDSVVQQPNVQSILFREQEGSFLVGMLATLASKTGKVGFVGGMDIPLIRKFQCGYEQGAKYAGAKTEVFANMTGTTGAAWADPARGGELARAQFGKGADVVFAAAGGTGIGVYQAAKDAGKLAIGVDSDQDHLQPGTMLTSMLKRVDVAIYQAVTSWKPGVTVLGLKEGGVDYALDDDNAKLITADMKKKVDTAKADIVAGRIKVADYMADNACKFRPGVSTIKHVAARAGVSFTTVSHVLNGTRRVSDAARQRVEQAVAEMGYAPSAVARALKMSETHILGVLVPNITNPFFAELTRGIEDRCRQTDYSVFLCNSDDDPGRQLRYLQGLLERRVDGLVLAAAAGDASVITQRLASARVPTVVVDRSIPGLVADLVRVDHQAGAELAVAHLLSLGHRAVACISGPSEFAVSRARVAGWRQAMASARVRVDDGWLLEGDFSASAGHALTRRLLARGDVTALFASNDLQAIGALRAAAELGVNVPRDLSVIGFDGIELGSYVYPALTTVGYPIREMGEAAASVLVDRISGGPSDDRDVVLQAQLVLRESTGPRAA